jgi:hypothetical protein
MRRTQITSETLATLDGLLDKAYREGWRDAMLTVQRLTEEIVESASLTAPKTQPPISASAQHRRARRGSVPNRIVAGLAERDGQTYDELHHSLEVPMPSLRSAMRRLAEDRRVHREGKRWFLASDVASDAAQEQEGAPDASTSGARSDQSMPRGFDAAA